MFYIVDKRPGGGVIKYITVPFDTLKKAERERAELLSIYPKGHEWRRRLCIRHPDGTIINPDNQD